MILNFIWNINPDIFTFGPFQLKWLTALLVVGVLVARKLLFFVGSKESTNPSESRSVFNFTLAGAIIGARLFYVVFIEPDILLNKPAQIFFPFEFNPGFKFIGIGQFSMLGALVGVFIILMIYAKLKSKSYFWSLDRGVFLIAVIFVFLRAGNLLQSEYFGKPTESPTGILAVNKIEKGLLKLPCCAMRNPNGENPLDTVSLKEGKEMLHEGVGFKPLLTYLFFKDGATEQLVNEFLIGDVKTYLFELTDQIFEPGTEPLHYTIFVDSNNYMARIQTIGLARHPLQLYEGVLFLILTGTLIWYGNKHPKKHQEGRLASLLILSISGIHFFIEFMNVLPRPLIKSLPLTVDQYICLPIFLFGIVILITSYKKQKA
ncbi:MAG: prolipoprotein diacylglyceryl transferase [Cyclobacteriaceae bacterium]|nr:prolipoprotein diacylglyceryl transferase [Cyclobacteriaceae bacterium]